MTRVRWSVDEKMDDEKLATGTDWGPVSNDSCIE